MSSDLGEIVIRTVQLYDSTGVAVDADSLPTWAVTLPDASAGTPPTVLHGATGEYFVNYTTVQAGAHLDVWTATVGGLAVRFGPDVFHVRPSSPGPLLSLAEAKRHLRITSVDVARDEELRDFVDAATELCEDFTNRSYRRQTIVESHDGGKCGLLLRRTPVQSVTTVVESGGAVTSTGWVLDANAGTLTRGTTMATWQWIPGKQNVTVTYVTGVAVISPTVRQAVKVTLAHLWATQRGSSMPPPRGGDAEYATNSPGWSLPRRAEQLLGNDLATGFA